MIIPHLDGVACVVAALTPGHHVHVAAQEVHQLPLALVAPLGAQHHRHGHPQMTTRRLATNPGTQMTTDLRRLTHTNNNSYTIVLMPILCNRHLNKEDFKSRRESYYY